MNNLKNNYQVAKTINIKDVTLAKIVKNDIGNYQTETPIYLAPTLSVKTTSKFNSANFSGDGQVLQTMSSFAGGTIDIKLSDLSLAARAYIYNYEFDKNGIMIARAGQVQEGFALGYRYKMSNGKYGFVWYYNVTFNTGETINYDSIIDGKIKGDDIEIKGTFLTRKKDTLYRTEASESEIVQLGITTPKEILSTWFKNVIEPDFTAPKKPFLCEIKTLDSTPGGIVLNIKLDLNKQFPKTQLINLLINDNSTVFKTIKGIDVDWYSPGNYLGAQFILTDAILASLSNGVDYKLTVFADNLTGIFNNYQKTTIGNYIFEYKNTTLYVSKA